jgi:tripartite-type tricarboxylate transporter receptor subunit TctC
MVLAFNGPLAIAPLLQKLPYDVQKDLAPVITRRASRTCWRSTRSAREGRQGARRLREGEPGKLNYASVGNGSSSHLNGELLKALAGIDIVHIPFNGSPPAVTSTIQGETQMLFAVMQPLQPQIQAGKLRALAVTSANRFPLLPDLPTIAESGYPGFVALAWNGVLVPAATPKPIVARLNAEIDAILKQPDVVQKLNAAGFELVGGTPEQFGALIKSESDKWAPSSSRPTSRSTRPGWP